MKIYGAALANNWSHSPAISEAEREKGGGGGGGGEGGVIIAAGFRGKRLLTCQATISESGGRGGKQEGGGYDGEGGVFFLWDLFLPDSA